VDKVRHVTLFCSPASARARAIVLLSFPRSGIKNIGFQELVYQKQPWK